MRHLEKGEGKRLHGNWDQIEDGAGKEVKTIALRSLSEVVTQSRHRSEETPLHPIEYFSDALFGAVQSGPAEMQAIVQKMQQANIRSAVIAESYVPDVARRLGDGWVADTIDFASVTIGSSRLQGLLRRLGPEWEDRNPVGDRATCLVVVPQGCQHTLGASVLAGQLRCRGFDVQLELGVCPKFMTELVEIKRYSAVMVSASAGECLVKLTELVQRARSRHNDVPVLVGGSILTQNQDVQLAVHADLATSDVTEALEFCGLGLERTGQELGKVE